MTRVISRERELMTDRTPNQPVQHNSRAAPPPTPLGREADRPVRHACITAGVGILLIAVLAGFGKFVAVDGLVTSGDAARTATDIMASQGLFQFGVTALFVVVALDVVVAWALYRVFGPVSPGISLLAAWFRLVYAGVLLVAVSHLIEVLRLLGDDQFRAAFNADQLQAQALSGIHTFGDVFGAGLLLFGLHLLVVGYLAYWLCQPEVAPEFSCDLAPPGEGCWVGVLL